MIIKQEERKDLINTLISEWEYMKSSFTRKELEDDCGNSGIDVRLQVLDDELQLHVGDAQYDTSHQGYWGQGFLDYDWDEEILETLISKSVDDLVEQVQREVATDSLWMERFSD